jgi:hypothetical protein
MDGQDSSASVYSEAKSEYTKQLVFNFQPVLLRFFLDRFTEVKASQPVVSKAKSALSEFQESLSQIPEWNLDKVQKETATLLASVNCDYIDDLITAVFIGHTKILSAIRLHATPRRTAPIQITVPKPDHFMHRALSECSRLMWSNVYLFSDTVSSLERQKNMTQVNRFLEDGILQAIRNLLPVKSILRDSLREDDDDAIHITNSVLPSPVPDVGAGAGAEEEKAKEEKPKEEKPKEDEAPKEEDKPKDEDKPKEEKPKEEDKPKEEEKLKVEKLKEEPITPVISVGSYIPDKSSSDTLIVDTERSVGFTGVDSLFGDAGDAELRPMIEEGDDDLKIIGESEALNLDEFEDIDGPAKPSLVQAPLSADDYETL